MQTAQQFFIGIDVSKLTFDAALMAITDHQKNPIVTERFANNAAGLKDFGKWLKSHSVTGTNTLLVMENTGIYHRLLWQFCGKAAIPVHIGNAAHIKWSLGITRGKDDRTDSIRLCRYACKEADVLKAAPPLNPSLIRLKDLQTTRTRLLLQLNSNKTYLRELKNVSDASDQKILEGVYKAAIEGIAKSIKAVETQIKAILAGNEALKANYKLLLTVPGIGDVTAIYLLCCTANFAARPSGKQLACYAGLAPFERSSGTSIKGKPRVHKMANKELKKLLYMGARAVIQHNPEMRAYYDRKMTEGKHDLSVVNAVKNKIVLRVAAVVNNQRPYVNKMKMAA
jgi:transposase